MPSYAHRGQFITLPKIPYFDHNGIWFFDEIGFSQYGNSFESILKLIDKSKQGVSREELEDIPSENNRLCRRVEK